MPTIEVSSKKLKTAMPKAGYAYASHSLDRGAPVQLVQQTLGHTSNTLRYIHTLQALVSSSGGKRAMGRLIQFFSLPLPPLPPLLKNSLP
ncbi:hypothetical protein [Nostoc flagelliforme]|uniref:hypothetical protein n=1 Tax=Nostoc flagelliforme TaxID=1306274 RepID=UPI0018F05541|nr:hypothetical protein [Nostoc flagelliforme]